VSRSRNSNSMRSAYSGWLNEDSIFGFSAKVFFFIILLFCWRNGWVDAPHVKSAGRLVRSETSSSFQGEQFSWNFIRWHHCAYSIVVQLFRSRSQMNFPSQHFRKSELFSFNEDADRTLRTGLKFRSLIQTPGSSLN